MKSKLAVFILAILSFAAPVGCSYEITIDSDGDTVPDSEDACPNDRDLIQDEGECGCNYRKIKDRCVYLESFEDSDEDGTPDIFKDSDEDGTPDLYDHCPNDPNKIEPGTCGCGTPDTDTDGDTTPDCIDDCDDDPNKTEPGYCGCGNADLDNNGDSIIDCIDTCPDDPDKIDPGICGCGTPDTDTDNDGTPDCKDQCPDDPNKNEKGHCECGVPDFYPDGTSRIDCDDECPYDPNKTKPGFCGCGIPDDANNDNLVDCFAMCVSSTVGKELFGVCGCDTLDTDTDGDGTPDCIDECPEHPIKIKPGTCGCDTLDTDTDGDGTPDCIDDCPDDKTKIEAGICGCGIPDDDEDEDEAIFCGENHPHTKDHCPNDKSKTEPGFCGCGTPETGDSDTDGVYDCKDKCPHDPHKTEPGFCGCGTPETGDFDGDGAHDCIDKCPDDPQKQACPCHLSGRNAEVEIIEDGETKRIQVCMEEGGVLQVGYTNKFTATTHDEMLNAFNNRSISRQKIRLHYSPAGNLLRNPALEYSDDSWTILWDVWDGFVKEYGASRGDNCVYAEIVSLCRPFGRYPAFSTSHSWTNLQQNITLSNTQCKNATECPLPLTVGMFAFATVNNGVSCPSNKQRDDLIQIKLNGNIEQCQTECTLETITASETTNFFTMTEQIRLNKASQNINVTFSGRDNCYWGGNYGPTLHYFGAWLGEREIRFSGDGKTWEKWIPWKPATKGASDAWFVEWDLGTCDNNQETCTKTVYMQTHDLLTDRYYETSDSVQYIPEN